MVSLSLSVPLGTSILDRLLIDEPKSAIEKDPPIDEYFIPVLFVESIPWGTPPPQLLLDFAKEVVEMFRLTTEAVSEPPKKEKKGAQGPGSLLCVTR